MTDTQPVTDLLLELRDGGAAAVDRLYPLVYDELRRIAGRAFRGERSDHTLGTTGLVHEADGRCVRPCATASCRPPAHVCVSNA
jgi:hypothetical protein